MCVYLTISSDKFEFTQWHHFKGSMFEINFQMGQSFFRFQLNFQTSKLDSIFQIKSSGFSKHRSFGHLLLVPSLRGNIVYIDYLLNSPNRYMFWVSWIFSLFFKTIWCCNLNSRMVTGENTPRQIWVSVLVQPEGIQGYVY